MAITAKFTRADIQRDLNTFKQQVETDLINILKYVGEKFVKDARNFRWEDGGFNDQTGNLRSSMGYFILKDSAIIEENVEGTSAGIAAARRLVSELSLGNGYQIVGTAGMEYASHVESRGLNVITVQADVAIIDLERIIKKYEARINSMGMSVKFGTGNSVTTILT